MTVTVRNRDALRRALAKLTDREAQRVLGKALFAAGERIQVEAQLSLTRGAVSGKNHVPSSPGEPPNQDTGVLGGNIETVMTGPLAVEVSSNAPYSSPLEFGTSRMAARPFMRPARDKEAQAARALMVRAVNSLLKRR